RSATETSRTLRMTHLLRCLMPQRGKVYPTYMPGLQIFAAGNFLRLPTGPASSARQLVRFLMQHCEGHGCTGYTFLRKANRNRRDGRARTRYSPISEGEEPQASGDGAGDAPSG